MPERTDPAPPFDTLLLDIGGVFLLPSSAPLLAAFERVGFGDRVDDERLARAHYAGAAAFTDVFDAQPDLREFWDAYLHAFVAECGVPEDARDDVITHVGPEFATDGLWRRVIDGSVDALRALAATGVQLGVVSNAGGTMADRLRELEVLQVGAGMGVEVGTLIDSGAVGIEKPDPRIFHLALGALGADPSRTAYLGDMPLFDVLGARRAGLRPFLMDPYGFQSSVDCERVRSLTDLAQVLVDASS